MSENQKLREVFEARMTDDGKWPNAIKKGRNGCYLLAQTENAWSEWKACAELIATSAQQDWAEATGLEVINCPNCGDLARSANPRQALALPTAAPVGDLPELPEPAAWRTPDEWPMCYQYTHEEPDAERIQWAARYGRKHEQVFTADQMRAYARAALSAGDAVDAQRYRWLKGRSQVCLNQVWIGGYTTRQRDGDFLSKEDALSAIETAIDAAMRKGQL